MDFINLYSVLPKYPQAWSIEDVTSWLEFINLNKYISCFREASVDGSCISLIDDEILEHQLGIKSGIIRKKLMNWTSKGLQQYSQYLDICTKMVDQSQEVPLLTKTQTSCLRGSLINSSNKIHESHAFNDQIEEQMIIQSFQGNNLGTHIIKRNQQVSIGYDKANDIQSLQSTFHNKHAIIGHNGLSFFIKDLGSKFGSFIKIQERTVLCIGSILEIGSFQFQVKKIDRITKTILLRCIVGDLQKEMEQQIQKQPVTKVYKKQQLLVQLHETNKFTFGRRKDNSFQRNDKHMSGIHCKITFFNNNFHIEDFGSTNGTWIRLSSENKVSGQFPIKDESIIKIGTTVTYLCRENRKKNQTQTSNNVDIVCRICMTEQNNCLFYPCSHNIVCYKCSHNIDSCVQCGHSVEQKIKIHK